MDKIENSFILKKFMAYGAVIGTIMVCYSLILFNLGTNEFTNENPSFLTNLRVLIMSFGIYLSLKNFEKVTETELKFWKYIWYGILISVFFGIIYSFYYVMFFKYVSPETLTFYEKTISDMYKTIGMPQEQIDFAVELYKQPVMLFVSSFFQNLILSAIISFIFSIFNLIMPKPKIK